MPYSELSGLEEIYLEDSFVLDVRVTPAAVVVELDAVLRDGHSEFEPPPGAQQYCFRRGELRLLGVKRVEWEMPRGRPAVDATGETDYGGVDSYEVSGSVHRLVGEIGNIAVTCTHHEFVLYPVE